MTDSATSSSNTFGFGVGLADFNNDRAFETDALICFTFKFFAGCKMFEDDGGIGGGGGGIDAGTGFSKSFLVAKFRLASFSFSMQLSINSVAIEIGSKRFE